MDAMRVSGLLQGTALWNVLARASRLGQKSE